MTARAVARDLLQRLAYAAPVAWRQDRVFRIAAIGAGATGALLLVRVAGPHLQTLPPPASTVGSAGVPYLPGPGQTASPPATVQTIAPGHALSDVIVVPAREPDRFGTAPPMPHP